MRDRLIELIASKVCDRYEKDQCTSKWNGCCGECLHGRDFEIGDIADHLLSNGVIVPPCKIGTHLWRVTHPYRKEPKVTEFVVKNFKTVGKKHRLQIEVQAVNVPATNWMYYHQFHTSREDAEKELYEKQHPQERDL